MKRPMIAAALAGSIALANAGANAKTLSIGPDMSGSNPLLAHENFAYGAAQYVRGEIMKLEPGDVVNVKTFGARSEAVNVLTTKIIISRQVSPQKVADLLEQYIRSLPQQSDAAQASTNLIAYLEFTPGFDCANGGEILVITDGLESSSLVDGASLLDGSKGLPEPQVDLAGCQVTFYGLGAGWQPQSIRHVRGQWMSWFEKAGATFTAIIP